MANHKKDFDSKMDLDINIVNVNIDINFGQVAECGWHRIVHTDWVQNNKDENLEDALARNKLASLEATLVWKYDPPTDRLTNWPVSCDLEPFGKHVNNALKVY